MVRGIRVSKGGRWGITDREALEADPILSDGPPMSRYKTFCRQGGQPVAHPQPTNMNWAKEREAQGKPCQTLPGDARAT